jgi:hypothetical protein
VLEFDEQYKGAQQGARGRVTLEEVEEWYTGVKRVLSDQRHQFLYLSRRPAEDLDSLRNFATSKRDLLLVCGDNLHELMPGVAHRAVRNFVPEGTDQTVIPADYAEKKWKERMKSLQRGHGQSTGTQKSAMSQSTDAQKRRRQRRRHRTDNSDDADQSTALPLFPVSALFVVSLAIFFWYIFRS